jgi:anti-sigma regulatory factor (Ser/Thr protein kinase)
MAARRARELRELTEGGTRPVTVLSEHISRFDGPDGSYWTELDAAMNVALADLPVRLTCFFPELPLHAQILDGARQNHPQLLIGGELRLNPEHRCPRVVLTDQPSGAPDLLGPPDVRLTFGAWQLQDVRAAVEQAVQEADYQPDHAEDVVLAVNEVATNAVEHGGSDAELYIWTGEGLVCEVHDRGVLGDPLPGLQAPHPSNPKGRGVWIARQLCDTLHIWADSAGTHVRMRASR